MSLLSSTSNDENDARVKTTIRVEFQRDLPPSISPKEAKDAWLNFVWRDGGGLLALVWTQGEGNDKRLILPAFMEETLINNSGEGAGGDSDEGTTIEYRVSNWPIPDYVDDSHLGSVEFVESSSAPGEEEDTTTKLIWKTEFDVLERYELWKGVTETLISQACDNLVAYLRPPMVYTRKTRLRYDAQTVTPKQIQEKWLAFIWDGGGGLPVYKPFVLKPRQKRMYIPPFLSESILSINDDDNAYSEITYQLDIPAFIACHKHVGYVQFKSVPNENDDESSIDMTWKVQIVPYHNCEGYARGCVSSVVTILARNFQSHIHDPTDSMVAVRPPRGGGDSAGGLFQVRKDSWLGGVLDAHLRDQRSTLEQTIAMFQPHTWGRSTDNIEEGEFEKWTSE